MSTIAVAKKLADFQHMTPICGNCRHENRVRDEAQNRTNRDCALHGWFVLMSGTCKSHEYRQKGTSNDTSQR
jgi:NADH pyrophosphatase NudC (nudix superfamily)